MSLQSKFVPDPHEKRAEFLMEIYRQMFNDINTHILVVWQSVGVLVGALALFALVEKGVLTIDWASSLVVFLAAWLLAHLYDASYWYNRNLVIIANIERQFLYRSDLHAVHYYFGKHRANTMLTHLRIQWVLGIGVAVFYLCLHFVTQVLPGWGAPWSSFRVQKVLPYLIAVIGGICLLRLRRDRAKAYAEFLENSPGVEVNTEGVEYGVGHPVDRDATS